MNSMENQDIVHEILLRLPPKSLGRSKSLSKDWYSFISYNPAFRNNYRSRNKGRCYLMMGIFFSKQLPYEDLHDDVKFIRTCIRGTPVTSRNKKRTRNDDAKTASMPLIDEKLSFLGHLNINVLATSNGAVLASTELICPENYFICNPITKQHITLPTFKTKGGYYTHGFICSAITNLNFEKGIEYKVVRSACFPLECSNTMCFSILSSECPDEWKFFNFGLTCETNLCLYHHNRTIISEQGLIYMLGERRKDYRNCLVIVDETKREAKVEDLPYEEKTMSDHFGQSNQFIFYAVNNLTHIKIWGLNESNDGTRKWSLKHIIGAEVLKLIQPCQADEKWRSRVRVNAFHPTNPNIVFCYIYGRYYREDKHVSYDFYNSRWEQTCDREVQSWKYSYYPFPYTCDVVFAPHLFF